MQNFKRKDVLCRKKKIKIKITVFVFWAIIIGSALWYGRAFSYNDTITHPSLTGNVAKVYKANFEQKLTDQEIIIEDQNSANGTYVKNNRIKQKDISLGEIFKIADMDAVIENVAEGSGLAKDDLKKTIHSRVIERMNLKKIDITKLGDEELKNRTKKWGHF